MATEGSEPRAPTSVSQLLGDIKITLLRANAENEIAPEIDAHLHAIAPASPELLKTTASRKDVSDVLSSLGAHLSSRGNSDVSVSTLTGSVRLVALIRPPTISDNDADGALLIVVLRLAAAHSDCFRDTWFLRDVEQALKARKMELDDSAETLRQAIATLAVAAMRHPDVSASIIDVSLTVVATSYAMRVLEDEARAEFFAALSDGARRALAACHESDPDAVKQMNVLGRLHATFLPTDFYRSPADNIMLPTLTIAARVTADHLARPSAPNSLHRNYKICANVLRAPVIPNWAMQGCDCQLATHALVDELLATVRDMFKAVDVFNAEGFKSLVQPALSLITLMAGERARCVVPALIQSDILRTLASQAAAALAGYGDGYITGLPSLVIEGVLPHRSALAQWNLYASRDTQGNVDSMTTHVHALVVAYTTAFTDILSGSSEDVRVHIRGLGIIDSALFNATMSHAGRPEAQQILNVGVAKLQEMTSLMFDDQQRCQ